MNSSTVYSAANPHASAQSLPFPEFIESFKSKLRVVFGEHGSADHLSVNRGLQPLMVKEIMAYSPLSFSIPKVYGGRAGIVRENLEILSAASYESLALSLTIGINSALFLQPVGKYAEESVRSTIFKRFLDDKLMGGLMITEPGHGSDALGMQTNYTEHGDHYHLKGKKHWQGLTGYANYWLVGARNRSNNGDLKRDIDFFICDMSQESQKIVVEEYFENLGLYMIPYGLNRIDVKVPRLQRLQPHTSGIHMMLDLLHRSRILFPGMGLGFIKRMLDEAMLHCHNRLIGNKCLLNYDQVQHRLARLQADFTICSALCVVSSDMADINNDLVPHGIEANIIKSVTADLMQESSQSLLQLVGAKGYRLNHLAGRATVDSRPFQIFEGSNDILYTQISENVLKLMKNARETNFFQFLKGYTLTSRSANYLKDLLNFDAFTQTSQRKMVELGKVISRIVSMEYVLKMGDLGFHSDLISGAIAMLQQEITVMVSSYSFKNVSLVVEEYEEKGGWQRYVK